MKFLFFANGPGETSQAYSAARYFIKQKHTVILALRQKTNLSFIPPLSKLEIRITPSVTKLTQLVKSAQPEAVILCNSKSFNTTNFSQQSPWKNTPTFTLDSNWLFNNQSTTYRFVNWAQKYFINIPPKIFQLGLKKNRGYFSLESNLLSKIQPIGFIPSYSRVNPSVIEQIRKKSGITANQKMIFCYFSGYGAGAKSWVLDNLIRAVEKLRTYGQDIAVVYIGKTPNVRQNQFKWFKHIPKEALNLITYFETLSSADLVFQHQGLATLEQAISAKVPVITNVINKTHREFPQLHKAEVSPFAKLGLCRLLFKSTSSEIIKQNVQDLLYNQSQIQQMRLSQQKYYSQGEKDLLNALIKKLKK